MKFLIFTMSPGETGQCAAIAKLLMKNGHQIYFGYLNNVNPIIIDDLACTKKLITTGIEVKKLLASGRFNAVIFGNSKFLQHDQVFQQEVPVKKPICVSLDSNWLFNQPVSYPFIQWLDKIYLNFPEDVYKFGLAENGGNYTITEEVQKKIKTVGLIPSYEIPSQSERNKVRDKLGIHPEQKLIFCYIGSGYTFKKQFYPKLISILDCLDQKKYNFKAIYLSGDEPKNKPWLIPVGGGANSQVFYQYLSASDLVLQHQGLGTLEQAISANVPDITNVAPVDDKKDHNHVWEVGPFEKAGLCKMHLFDDSIDSVVASIQDLLEGTARKKMIDSQINHYSVGEKSLYNDLMGLL